MQRSSVLALLLGALLFFSTSSAQANDYDWGLGFGLLGPSPFVDVQLHWFPAQWLGLDVGGIALAAGGATGHVGARLRPFEFSSFRPFIGASATGVVAFGTCTAPQEDADAQQAENTQQDNDGCGSRTSSFAGPRVGVEMELGRDSSVLLGVEADAFFSLDDSGVLYSDDPDAITWWGGAYFLWLF